MIFARALLALLLDWIHPGSYSAPQVIRTLASIGEANLRVGPNGCSRDPA